MNHIYFSLMLTLTMIEMTAQKSIIGFNSVNAEKQRALESEFDSKLSAKNLDTWMQRMSAHPHYVGTEYGRKNAEWMVSQFESWGYEARIETYYVLFPYPKVRLLEMTSPAIFEADLAAIPVEGDSYTLQGDELLPSYNAFSTDGDVEAEWVLSWRHLSKRGL